MKRAVLRPLAEQDLLDAAAWYIEQGGLALGGRAFDAARDALEPLMRMPGLGAPVSPERGGVPGLRHWGVSGFPLQWFYFERDDTLDVVRLLGERRDIATILSDDPPQPR